MPLTVSRQEAARCLLGMESIQDVVARRESLATVAGRRLESLRLNLIASLRAGLSDKSAAKVVALLQVEQAQRDIARVVNASGELFQMADRRIYVGPWELSVGRSIRTINGSGLALLRVASEAADALRMQGGNGPRLRELGERLVKLNVPVAVAALLVGSLACLLCSKQTEEIAA